MSREHVTYHIEQNPNLYDVREVSAPLDISRPTWRLTVDYKEDFELMNEIFSRLYKPNSFMSYRDVVYLLDKNKNLLQINEQCKKYINI